jgi:hypothetical protein
METHGNRHIPNDASYAPLEVLVSKIHQLKNRSSLVNLPYIDFKKGAPPKKWVRETIKGRSAAGDSFRFYSKLASGVGAVTTHPRTRVCGAAHHARGCVCAPSPVCGVSVGLGRYNAISCSRVGLGAVVCCVFCQPAPLLLLLSKRLLCWHLLLREVRVPA